MRPVQPILALLLTAGLLSGCGTFQSASDVEPSTTRATADTTDTDDDDLKAFSEVIKDDFVKDEGIFTVYRDDEDYYYVIPDSVLGLEFLQVTRTAKVPAGAGYGGQKANTQVVRWDRQGDKVMLKVVSYENVADPDDPIYEAVRNSNLEPIMKAFDIESYNEDTTGVVIQVDDLYTTDIPSLGLSSFRRSAYSVRRLDGDRSYITHVASYPENVEVRHVLTYDAQSPPSNSSTNTLTVEMSQSMVLLPADPMKPRLCDDRVGFFSVTMTDYSSDRQKADEKCYITRWRLEPSDPEAYARGELVEPVEPIVYYLDRNTPEKWREPLMQGVEDWQSAFEEAGFKNAIVARMAPTSEEDSTFSPEDARYSVIRYFASDVQNASGPHVHDPRTGEILETDINWYHNIQNLLRNWYFVHTAAANPEARGVEFEDEVMGQLLRFVSAHEVGHTLGFPHNMGSSFAYTVDQLRDPEFTSTHGTAPSIMDYARFNYVAQPGDGVTQFMPALGEYDDWVTEWGYSWFDGDLTPEQEEERLHAWTLERADDPLYDFGSGGLLDPRAQTEDLTNDAMEASRLGIQNLDLILDNLVQWTADTGRDYEVLEELYGQVIGQYRRYIGHVSANVAGVYEDHKTYDQEGVVYSPTPADRQRAAMEWMGDYVFETPDWIIRHDILNRIEGVGVMDRIRSIQVNGLNRVLDFQRMARLLEAEAVVEGDVYTVRELLDDVRVGVFHELNSAEPIDPFRRNLQRAWVDRMETIMTTDAQTFPSVFLQFGYMNVNVSQSDLRAYARGELERVKLLSDRAAARAGDDMTELHLNDLSARIEDILDGDD